MHDSWTKFPSTLQWRHRERDDVLNHWRPDCLLNDLFGCRSKKTSSSASLAFVRGIHRSPVNSPHKGPVTRKMFPFDDVIMIWIMITNLLPPSLICDWPIQLTSNSLDQPSIISTAALCHAAHICLYHCGNIFIQDMTFSVFYLFFSYKHTIANNQHFVSRNIFGGVIVCMNVMES